MNTDINIIVEEIKKITSLQPQIGLILGSGWSDLTDLVKDPVVIPYKSLTGMPICTVKGHGGNFIIGKLFNKVVLIMQGRFHLYEGYSAPEVVIPLKIMNALGVKKLVITNAAGGLNLRFQVGDIMIIDDHINLTGQNPLLGVVPTENKPIFIDTTKTYSNRIKKAVLKTAAINNIPMQTGVYAQVLGPNYETNAECNMLRILGADAVAMSTVMESLYAQYLGMEIFAMSCITNITGTVKAKVSHEEVMSVTKQNAKNFKTVLTAIIKEF